MYSKDFGFKIKQLREKRGISQEQLAEVLKISQSKLSKIENGRIKKIDFILMNKLCQHFSITIDKLINIPNGADL